MRKGLDFSGSPDVVVVGGGVAGLGAARELARRNFSVVVVEGGEPGGASRAAGGMLAPQAEADRDDALFRLLCESRDMYPAFAEALGEESGVDIQLERTGTLYLAFSETDEEEVERRFAWQKRAGLHVERVTCTEARLFEPAVSPNVRAALRFPRDWQVENRELVRALGESVRRYGVRELKDERARGVRVVAGRVAGVETNERFIAADVVLLAAGAHTSQIPLLFAEPGATRNEEHGSWPSVEGIEAHPKIEPVRGQMLCARQTDPSSPFVRHVVYSPRGYLVPRRDGRLLAGSTSEYVGFDSGVTTEGLQAISANAREIAPAFGQLDVVESWAGLRPRAEDGLPLLGESGEVRGLFYATGYYRNGILLAPVAGEIIAALVAGEANQFTARALEAFSPARLRRAFAASHEK